MSPVIHIDFAPHRTKGNGELSASTAPPHINGDAFRMSGRERIKPPTRKFEYLPETSGIKLRDDLKPLHIIQPEGPSFKINGHELEWQKWKMHVAFNAREGIAISTITYNDNGTIRPIFYRLSLVEMVVPYGAPEFPHPRKVQHPYSFGWHLMFL
jgi:primary-amine oxidase